MEQTEHFDAAFRDTLLDVVKALHGRGHLLSYRLRVESKHVYTYPKGRAYREQLNVGWYSRDQAWMRIGVGYRRVTNSDEGVADLLRLRGDIEKEGDREILESSSKLVDRVADVFDKIKASPFGP